MNSIEEDLESRKTTMRHGSDMVTLYATAIDNLWLATKKDCARVRADLSPYHRPNVWRFDSNGALFLIESLPALDISAIQADSLLMFVLTKSATHLQPIVIKFREYKKPDMFFAGEGVERIMKP